MENENLHEQMMRILNGLNDEQTEKAKNCKTLDDFLAFAKKEGIELPDEILNDISGGVQAGIITIGGPGEFWTEKDRGTQAKDQDMAVNKKGDQKMADEKKAETLELNDKELNKVAGGGLTIHDGFTCFICHKNFRTSKAGSMKMVDGDARMVCNACGGNLESFNPYKVGRYCYICNSYFDGFAPTVVIDGHWRNVCKECYSFVTGLRR